MVQLNRYWYVGLISLIIAVTAALVHQSAAGKSEKMTFIVGFDDPTLMEGVQVLLAKKDGELVTLGHTDGGGLLEVDGTLLREEGLIVVFCREGFFCGSFLLSEPDFFEYHERYIELAPLA